MRYLGLAQRVVVATPDGQELRYLIPPWRVEEGAVYDLPGATVGAWPVALFGVAWLDGPRCLVRALLEWLRTQREPASDGVPPKAPTDALTDLLVDWGLSGSNTTSQAMAEFRADVEDRLRVVFTVEEPPDDWEPNR